MSTRPSQSVAGDCRYTIKQGALSRVGTRASNVLLRRPRVLSPYQCSAEIFEYPSRNLCDVLVEPLPRTP
jgi:hypothetical protein